MRAVDLGNIGCLRDPSLAMTVVLNFDKLQAGRVVCNAIAKGKTQGRLVSPTLAPKEDEKRGKCI